MYTGGLENHPVLIDRWALNNTLLGNSGATLHAVRNPWRLARLLANPGTLAAEVRRQLTPSDAPDEWLNKPLRGSGGSGIETASARSGHPGQYFQRYVTGRSVSAVFIASATGCQLAGVTRQLVGEPWLHAGPYQYCGSIGPLRLSRAILTQWRAIGSTLSAGSGMRGLFGVDAIETDAGLVVIEVNPRYTASVEVIELATGVSLVAQHTESFGHVLPMPKRVLRRPGIIGKAVYFAPKSLIWPAAGPWDGDFNPQFHLWRPPRYADVPWPGTAIHVGNPVISRLVTGKTPADCEHQLRRAAGRLDQLFGHKRAKSPGATARDGG